MSGSRSSATGALEHASEVFSAEHMALFKESGAWTDTLMVDLLDRHAREQGDSTAIVDEMRRVTWTQLADRVDRLAAAFVDAGLKPGEFVGIQLPNRIEFIETFLAAQRCGLRALTMMMIYREKDVAFMLDKCRAVAYVTMDHYRGFDHVGMARQMLDRVATLRKVVILGDADEGMSSYDHFIHSESVSAGAFTHLRPDPDGLARVSFTSGTTGYPKGVAHTCNTDLVPPLLTARALGLTRDTPIWMPSPICHTTGLAFGVYDSLICGAKLVLQDVWDPERALDLVSREQAVFTVSATPFISSMLDVPGLSRYDLSRFRYFVSGGARIPSSLVERARDEMDCYLLRVFGMAEAPLHTLNLPEHPWEKLVTRDGKVMELVKVKVVDPEDRTRQLQPGEIGEYATWGPHVFLGYYDNPEATAEARDADGWYFSSDLCLVDEEDFVLYVDRMKDIINRGGVKISALEVENLLMEHPHIRGVAVVAIPDDRLGEKACAFVVPRSGEEVSLTDLQDFLNQRGVTKQKWPERLELVSDFPTTTTGKIQKNVLRDSLVDHPNTETP